MSQTKNYKLPINKTIVKTYILKKSKFRTDLHTHMNANLSPDCLIALGIMHQVRYPLYYIKKLNLKLSKQQEEKIYLQRKEVEKQFKNSELQGKYLTRKIDDNTFINFAEFILNNLENDQYNIEKIRTSLAILKDGQAVFTNLEKTYIYRYVFAKGTPSMEKIKLTEKAIKTSDNPYISECHVSIQKINETIFITDKSPNGTCIFEEINNNDAAATKTRIQNKAERETEHYKAHIDSLFRNHTLD